MLFAYKLACLFTFLIKLPSILAFTVAIDAHGEECFYDNVRKGTKMSLTFEVSSGGFLDIDVKITDPNGKVLHSGERESNGKYTFSASMDGIYTYCFGNKMSSMTPKEVMFNMDIGEKPSYLDKASNDGVEGTENNLENMISELSNALSGVKHEQDYMEVRERIHRSINDNTNFRVVLWSFFEALVLMAMTVGQVFYLKRFFEVRRVV